MKNENYYGYSKVTEEGTLFKVTTETGIIFISSSKELCEDLSKQMNDEYFEGVKAFNANHKPFTIAVVMTAHLQGQIDGFSLNHFFKFGD